MDLNDSHNNYFPHMFILVIFYPMMSEKICLLMEYSMAPSNHNWENKVRFPMQINFLALLLYSFIVYDNFKGQKFSLF